MADWFLGLMQGDDFSKSLFLMIVGILGVFIVLLVYYLLIKLLSWIFPPHKQSAGSGPAAGA